MEQAPSVREGFSPPAGYFRRAWADGGVGQVPLLNLTLRALADEA
jgi:hypothetical protein